MLKHKLLFRENDLIILYVGRLDPSKGLDLLISSFYNVTAKLDNAHLIIVGDGDYDTYIKKCFSIRNKITFTGKITKENLYGKIIDKLLCTIANHICYIIFYAMK